MFQNRKFTVGEKLPEWFKEYCSSGRAKVIYDDEGDFEKIIIYAPAKTYEAKKDDVVLLLKSGLTVLTKEQAAKYKVLPKKEANKDEE